MRNLQAYSARVSLPTDLATFPLWPIIDGKCACGDETCERAGKHPRVKWSTIQKGEQRPGPEGSGTGIATGGRSGIIVLDFDTVEALEKMERDPATPLPATYMVKTHRGAHLYFKWPGFYCRNSAGKLAAHVDVRGDGGFVVAPGSPHKAGGVYEALGNVPIAPCPQWLLDWPGLKSSAGQFRDATDNAPIPVDPASARGQKSITLAREYLDKATPAGDGTKGVRWELCLHLVRFLLLPVDIAYDLIVESGYPERCNPPWELSNVAHKLEEARDRSYRAAGGVDLGGFASRIARENGAEVAAARMAEKEHTYIFDPISARRVPRTYTTKDGTEKTAALTKADFDALVCELNGDPDWVGAIRYNDFDNKIHIVRPPFRMEAEKGCARLIGSDISALRVWLAYNKDCTATIEDIPAAVDLIARGHRYHPIREWLEALPAPSTTHLDNLAFTLFGDARPLAQDFVRKQLVASIARIYEPGCKVDTVLTLVGPRGYKKTSVIQALYRVPGCPNFRSDLPDIRNMQVIGPALEGIWVAEMAELNAVKKADEDSLKSFLTRQEERYSPKYVAGEIIRPRQCIFWASTNDEEFLPRHDAAFRRRFWCVNVTRKCDMAWVSEHNAEIWSEALALYRAGGKEAYWFDDEDLPDAIKEEHTAEDSWEERVEKALLSFKPINGEKTRRVTNGDIFSILPGNAERMPSNADFQRISQIAKATGLERIKSNGKVYWILKF